MSSERDARRNEPPAGDLRVARALKAMREAPSQSWNVQRLAKLAGASRATFARLFLGATGKSPKRWLREHRLELAARRLASTDDTLAEVAAHVGYVSEFALSRAFKRHHGIAPALYRDQSTTIRAAA
jgi:transcriptional regulator GlxA family with amidase domain